MPTSVASRPTAAVALALALLAPGFVRAQPPAGGPAGLSRIDGPCRVKLRSGRVMTAAGIQPIDEAGAFWRVEVDDGGSIIVPVRELRGVVALRADAPAAAAPLGGAPPPSGALSGGEPGATCDPSSDPRIGRWDELIAVAAQRHDLPAGLVRAIVAVESCGDPGAVSPKGAVGLMQVLPTTAADYGSVDLRDPASNLDTGCRHLARLMGKLDAQLELVLAAYNAGEGAVARHRGVPRFRETRAYVRQVLGHCARLGVAPEASAAL